MAALPGDVLRLDPVGQQIRGARPHGQRRLRVGAGRPTDLERTRCVSPNGAVPACVRADLPASRVATGCAVEVAVRHHVRPHASRRRSRPGLRRERHQLEQLAIPRLEWNRRAEIVDCAAAPFGLRAEVIFLGHREREQARDRDRAQHQPECHDERIQAQQAADVPQRHREQRHVQQHHDVDVVLRQREHRHRAEVVGIDPDQRALEVRLAAEGAVVGVGVGEELERVQFLERVTADQPEEGRGTQAEDEHQHDQGEPVRAGRTTGGPGCRMSACHAHATPCAARKPR